MADNMILYVLMGVLVLGFFVALWVFDARRAKEEKSDPERADVAPRGRRRGGRRNS